MFIQSTSFRPTSNCPVTFQSRPLDPDLSFPSRRTSRDGLPIPQCPRPCERSGPGKQAHPKINFGDQSSLGRYSVPFPRGPWLRAVVKGAPDTDLLVHCFYRNLHGWRGLLETGWYWWNISWLQESVLKSLKSNGWKVVCLRGIIGVHGNKSLPIWWNDVFQTASSAKSAALRYGMCRTT